MKQINIEKILLQAFSDESFKKLGCYKSCISADNKLKELRSILNSNQIKILEEYLELEIQYIDEYNIEYGKYIFNFLKSFLR